jgi:hypothetical protein
MRKSGKTLFLSNIRKERIYKYKQIFSNIYSSGIFTIFYYPPC